MQTNSKEILHVAKNMQSHYKTIDNRRMEETDGGRKR